MREELVQLREEKKLTQQQVADYLGITRAAYAMYEAGKRNPKPGTLKKLCEFFEVPSDYLIGVGGAGGDRANAVRVPVFGVIPAGIPLEAIEDILDWEEIPTNMLHGGKEYFALEVKGVSMYPDYQEGDRIIVQKTPTCNSGDVCVVYVNGYDATLKQVKIDSDGSVTLVPRNPEFPEKHFTREEVTKLPLSIAGVVVEIRRKIKKK